MTAFVDCLWLAMMASTLSIYTLAVVDYGGSRLLVETWLQHAVGDARRAGQRLQPSRKERAGFACSAMHGRLNPAVIAEA